ncbi:MAG TPA: hypothetical protein PKJ12_10830, partial [Ottowia sp.]|nr:hypothetical protein [Ottowia sp.]
GHPCADAARPGQQRPRRGRALVVTRARMPASAARVAPPSGQIATFLIAAGAHSASAKGIFYMYSSGRRA